MLYDLNDKADKKRFENDLKNYCDKMYPKSNKHKTIKIIIGFILVLAISLYFVL